MRRLFATALLVVSASARAVPPPPPPPMSPAKIISASAAGAVVAATCGRGGADVHRRNAQASARQMLQAQRALPKDFDARFLRAWTDDSRRMKALTAAQRKTVCARMAAQGVRFQR